MHCVFVQVEHCACDNAGTFCLVVSDKGAVYFGGVNKKGEAGEAGSYICKVVNPRRACTVRVRVHSYRLCLSVCLSVCLLSDMSPLELLFVLKMLSHTQWTTQVEKFVAFSLTASFQSYGTSCIVQLQCSRPFSMEYANTLLKCNIDHGAGFGQ